MGTPGSNPTSLGSLAPWNAGTESLFGFLEADSHVRRLPCEKSGYVRLRQKACYVKSLMFLK